MKWSNMAPVWPRDGPVMAPLWPRYGPVMAPLWPRDGPSYGPIWPRYGAVMSMKCPWDGAVIAPYSNRSASTANKLVKFKELIPKVSASERSKNASNFSKNFGQVEKMTLYPPIQHWHLTPSNLWFFEKVPYGTSKSKMFVKMALGGGAFHSWGQYFSGKKKDTIGKYRCATFRFGFYFKVL